jgi:hypothetical protein
MFNADAMRKVSECAFQELAITNHNKRIIEIQELIQAEALVGNRSLRDKWGISGEKVSARDRKFMGDLKVYFESLGFVVLEFPCSDGEPIVEFSW